MDGFTYEDRVRFSHKLTLAAPFSGDVSYGGGAYGTEEIWFWIVPARKTAFVLFGFGATPRPLKKGANQGAHGTLTDGPGDYYYMQLPTGYWRFTFKVNTTALPASKDVGFIAKVNMLDERGADILDGFLTVSFRADDPVVQGTEKVIKVDAPEFIKLRAFSGAFQMGAVRGFPEAAPMTYMLTVEPASPSEYQSPPARP